MIRKDEELSFPYYSWGKSIKNWFSWLWSSIREFCGSNDEESDEDNNDETVGAKTVFNKLAG